MRIDSIEVYGYDLSYRHGEYVMSSGRRSEKQSSTVVRIVTDEGIEGWGECAPLAGSYLPSHTEGVRASVGSLSPHLVGMDPRNTGLVNLVMSRQPSLRPGAEPRRTSTRSCGARASRHSSANWPPAASAS